MKKIYPVVLIAIMTSLLISMISTTSAHIGSDVNSLWAVTTPTIDGTLAPGEWTDAANVSFTMEMRSRTDGSLNKILDGRFYVKNDWNKLYFLIQIFNDDYEAQDFANRWNGLCVLFDENHNGVIDVGDNGEGVTTWTGSPFYSKNDLYYSSAGFWDADVNAGKNNDGNLAWSHTNPTQGAVGNWTFEMAIPLIGSDGDAYDFAISSLPKTVGFKIWFQEPGKGTDGVYPDDPTDNVNINEISNGTTFGTLIIHPLYTLTIQTTSGGTTNPIPGQYQYPYGAIVNVIAIPNSGYKLDHWELDSVNVGSTNPYAVLMNQNHTLKAVFSALPTVVGGYSVSLVRKTSTPQLAVYTALVTLSGLVLVAIRRKRK